MAKLPKTLLRGSQKEVTDFVLKNPFCACFSEMGFGKTAAVATAIEQILKTREIKKCLIVSTLRVARDTWPDEIVSWEHTSGLTFQVIEGKELDRLRSARSCDKIHLINQENFVWLVEKAGADWPYEMIVFDDSEGFKSANRKTVPKKAICMHRRGCPLFLHEKSMICRHRDNCQEYTPGSLPETKEFCALPCRKLHPVRSSLQACITLCNHFKELPARFTRFGALCALAPRIKRLVHLTGTPSNKGLLDLWPLIFTLDGGERLGRTYTQYKNWFFNRGHNGFGYDLKPGAAEIIHQKIKDICIAVDSEAAVGLPECQHIERYIRLPGKADKLYKEFERDLLVEVDGDEIKAANNGVLAGKLLQVCGGAVYTGEGKQWKKLHTCKLRALNKIIKRHRGEPVLVGYNFGHELDRLKATYPWGIDIRDRRDAVAAWNRGEIPLMFAHPGSAGHGLNLQKGPGRVLVWFGLNWRLDYNKQLNKRLWRPGQTRKVFIYYIIAEGRADVHLMEGVAKYDYTQKQLLEAVKRQAKERRE